MAALRYLPADSPRTVRRLDLPGVAALSASLLLIVLPLVLGRSERWPAWTWICLAASLPAFTPFLAAERRITAPGRIAAGQRARPRAAGNLLGPADPAGRDRHLLRTAVHTGPVPSARPGGQPASLRPGARPVGGAFGLAGQLVRRLPPRMAAITPGTGCLMLAAAYSAISIMLFTGHHVQVLLVVLLGAGALGLGIQFSALIRHLTTAVPAEYAADISGVSTTALQVGAAIGVAAFGTLYLSLIARRRRPCHACLRDHHSRLRRHSPPRDRRCCSGNLAQALPAKSGNYDLRAGPNRRRHRYSQCLPWAVWRVRSTVRCR
jgi:hypothetical protein